MNQQKSSSLLKFDHYVRRNMWRYESVFPGNKQLFAVSNSMDLLLEQQNS